MRLAIATAVATTPRVPQQVFVAEKTPLEEVTGERLLVSKGSHLDSEVVSEVKPGERLYRISEVTLNDGTHRACVALKDSINVLGWVTTRKMDGTPRIQRYARPVYEVVGSALKVRKHLDKDSRFIAQIHEGTRLHVTEIKKMEDGSTRASVCVLGHPKISDAKPVGWITVIRSRSSSNSSTIRELPEDGFEGRSIAALDLRVSEPPFNYLTLPRAPPLPPTPWLYSYSAPPSLASSPEGRPRSPGLSSRSNSPSVSPKRGSSPTPSGGFLCSPVHGFGEGSKGGSTPPGRRRSPKKSPPPTATSNDTDRSQQSTERARQAKLGGKHRDATVPSIFLAHSPAAAPEKKKPKKETGSGESKELLKVSALAEVMAEQQKAAKLEEAKLGTKEFRTLAMELGTLLQQKASEDKTGKFMENLMLQWDPNRDGNISKMEFRSNVKKLLPKADTKEIDALFEQLDDDGSGEMDVSEVKYALKKLQNAAVKASKKAAATHGTADALREKAAATQRVIDVTGEHEDALKELEDCNKKSVGAALGGVVKDKGLNVNDIVQKWGVATPGQVKMSEFRQGVVGLLPTTGGTEVDFLFASLDTDGGGSLDAEEMKEAIRVLMKESGAVKEHIRSVKQKVTDTLKAAKTAQKAWREERRAEQEAAAEAAAKAAREAEEAAAKAAEERAAKAAVAAEAKAAAAAAKAEQEARIAAKRMAA